MEWWNDGERRRQKTPVFDHLTSPWILLRAMSGFGWLRASVRQSRQNKGQE